MADIAVSVLARLKNKAAQTKRSNQLCLQLFCQEEFLRRVQHSRYADNLILKGGLFIYALTNFDSRVTVDVDFLLKNIPNAPDKLISVINEIITVNTGNDFITFEIAKIEPIAVTKQYVGIRAIVIARIKNTRTVFGIDFGIGDVITPKHEKRAIPTQLDGFETPLINAYSIETVIAEKVDAILSLMEFSSRMKDYYDILYLSRKFNFDGNILCAAISRTLGNRKRDFSIKQFDSLMALGNDVAMNKKWAAFLKKIKSTDLNFTDVLNAINDFIGEVLSAALEQCMFVKRWDCMERK